MSQEFIKELERQKAKQAEQGGFNTPAPLESVVDTVGQAPAVQSPFSQQAAAANNPLAAPIDLVAAPAVQTPQELTADSLGPVAFPGLQQQAMDTRLDAAGEEQQRMNAMSSTLSDGQIQKEREGSTVGGFVENAARKGFDYFFGAPTAEQAQNILDTQPTDPAQRARLQATAAGTGSPSDLSKAASYLFGRPENAGDPNILGSQTPSVVSDDPFGVTPEEIAAAGNENFGKAVAENPYRSQYGVNSLDQGAVNEIQQQGAAAPQAQAPQGLNSTQAMLQERFGSPTISGIQSAEEGLGLRTDAQGRMIDPNVDRSSFEKESAAREARQAARPDFGEAQTRAAGTVSDRERRAARGDDMSDADRRDIAKANRPGASASDIARGDKVAAANGIDRKTGKPLAQEAGMTFDQVMKLQDFDFRRDQESYRRSQDTLVTEGKAQAAFEQDEALLRQVSGDAGRIGRLTNEAIGLTTESGTTALSGSLLKNIPGTDANQLKEVLSVVTSKVALDRLMEIKKTGATLGQVSEKELELLQNSYDALKQGLSPERLRKALTAYATNLKEVEDKTSKAFVNKHGQAKFDAIMGGGGGGGTSGAIKNDRNVAGASDALLSSGKY